MAEGIQKIKFEHIMKRLIYILLVGGLLCLGSCNNKQVSQKKDAQESAENCHNKELNEILIICILLRDGEQFNYPTPHVPTYPLHCF